MKKTIISVQVAFVVAFTLAATRSSSGNGLQPVAIRTAPQSLVCFPVSAPRHFAAGSRTLGPQAGDRINIASMNPRRDSMVIASGGGKFAGSRFLPRTGETPRDLIARTVALVVGSQGPFAQIEGKMDGSAPCPNYGSMAAFLFKML